MVGKWCSERHRENSEGLRVIFGQYSDILKNDKLFKYNAKISRRLQIFALWGLAGMK